MSGFDQLHPALQHHIVNSLGWRELRPFQDAVIPQVLDGQHLIVLAPTAGGKTEAAFFPVMSRALSEGWSGLSVLYICPIKALLNNLDLRLQRYTTLLGRQSAVWHGDIKPSARKRILREPPDCLLTTPESLEVMLDSPNVDDRRLFANLQVVIIDEIHAFAGDDRGWHLLAVLERISRLAGRELQRIGLSATVGNPEMLADWLAGSCKRKRDVFLPADSGPGEADVTLDYVASLQNAAVVISRLHRGEKRLVFMDSRARAEQLGTELRNLGMRTYVTHSSLSPEQRRQAEEAFATQDDCVIVATSVLELGVDVGDLDRVIQIDAPTTVASFLQRMGRTGRRAGSPRNCLFLATRDESLIQAAGLIDLWQTGFVEPIIPPPQPCHIIAQQLMALTLQEGGIGRRDWFRWIEGVSGFAAIPQEQIERIVDGMLASDILWDEDGILGMGREGEDTFGRQHFLELFSVFMSPPLFAIRHGRAELGFVDEMTFLSRQEGARVLLLGGRAWQVTHIDWQRKVAFVEPSEQKGRSRWLGTAPGLGFHLCQAIQRVLASDEPQTCWSQRAIERLTELRDGYSWLALTEPALSVESDTRSEPTSNVPVLLQDADGSVTWWTFSGSGGNATIAAELARLLQGRVDHDCFKLDFDEYVTVQQLTAAIQQLNEVPPKEMRPTIDDEAITALKFSECIPHDLAVDMLARRLHDEKATDFISHATSRTVVLH